MYIVLPLGGAGGAVGVLLILYSAAICNLGRGRRGLPSEEFGLLDEKWLGSEVFSDKLASLK